MLEIGAFNWYTLSRIPIIFIATIQSEHTLLSLDVLITIVLSNFDYKEYTVYYSDISKDMFYFNMAVSNLFAYMRVCYHSVP